jgi:hypothetical protein
MSERPEGTPEEAPADPVEPAPTPELDSDAVAEDELLDESGIDPELEPEFEPEPEWEPVADAEAEADLEAALPDDATPAEIAAAAAAGSRRRRGPAPTGPRVPTPSERAVRVTDTPSRVFVIASVGIFVLILLYGFVAGHGGLLTATPSANPSASAPASASPAASTSTAPSSSAGSSSSAAPSGSPAASGSASPSTSAAPSVAVSPSPS